MKILAIEFSSNRRGVALLADGAVLASLHDDMGAATQAFAVLDACLKKAGVTASQVDRLAIGIGPGSYTAIRVAIAVAQGWHLAHGTELVGVDSFATLAEQCRATGLHGTVGMAVDAQRRELCVARYQVTAKTTELLGPLQLIPETEFSAWEASCAHVVGPDIQRWFPNSHPLCSDAETCARLAAALPPADPTTLAPVYIRDAQFVKAAPLNPLYNE